ncbi:MAG: MgtC/SapB family protein [bacterium]|nr:MgtC/SapB family protein [bacterium]
MDFLHTFLKLSLAVLFGGLVGLEREARGRHAGLRTFILVCLGATLMMMVSQAIPTLDGRPADPGRIAAQVVTGIGFLGAGTILREGPTIRGLTTAAGLWVVAGIGLATGAGMYAEAAAVTTIVLITLVVLSRLERAVLWGRDHVPLGLTILDQPGAIGKIGSALGARGVDIRDVQLRPGPQENLLAVEMKIRVPARLDLVELAGLLAGVDVVRSVDLSP